MSFYITKKCSGCGLCMKICPSYAVSGKKRERHSIDQNACIECGACGRRCPVNAVEDPFGHLALRVKKKMWEKPVFNLGNCMACILCVEACPTGSIALGDPDGEGLNANPYLASEKSCIACGFCAMECPVEAITMAVRESE